MKKITYLFSLIFTNRGSTLRIKHKSLVWLTLAFSLCSLTWASAAVTSLGFTIDKTNYMTVRKLSPTLKEFGINKYSKGKMLRGVDTSWGIRGLKSVTLIFDVKDKLTAIIMSMDKTQFNRITKYLEDKYTLKSKITPFVGNKSAVFRKDNITVKVNSPHMSFTMDVIYSTDSFESDYKRIHKRENQLTNKHEKSQF